MQLLNPPATRLQFGSTVYPTAASLATGALLYNAAGIISGLAGAAQGSMPTWDASSGTFADSIRAWGIATTSTPALLAHNTTAATAGTTVQYGPAIGSTGTAWNTSTLASVTERWRIECRPASGNPVTSALHFLRAQDAGAFTSVLNITSGGAIGANSYISANGCIISGNAALSTGHGSVESIYSTSTRPIILVQRSTTPASLDVANAVITGSCFDRNASSITNAATVHNQLVTWTDNADALREMINGYYDGSLWLAAGNNLMDAAGGAAAPGVHHGAAFAIRNFEEEMVIAAAASSSTANQIPAGAVVLAVTVRVTTVIPTAATFDVGVAGATTRYATGLSTAATTTGGTAVVPAFHAAAESIVITPNTSPANNTGRVRVACTYMTATAPTS